MPKRHDIAILHSSKRSDWRTPPELYAALDKEFRFEVDVAADAVSSLCDAWYGPGQSDPWKDGLAVDWRKDLVWPVAFMNPPYRRGDSKADPPVAPIPIEPWIEKAWNESQKGVTVAGVLPFSPQTEWYRTFVYGHSIGNVWRGHAAMEVRQLPYRVIFIDPDTKEPAANAPGNTCIVIWKPNPGYVGPWQPTVRYWSYR